MLYLIKWKKNNESPETLLDNRLLYLKVDVGRLRSTFRLDVLSILMSWLIKDVIRLTGSWTNLAKAS